MNWLWQILDPASISAFFTQFQAEMQQPAFWVALGKIMWINILLSGDNALVIAMACRGLPPRQRFWGMVLGAGVAVFLRIIFTGIVVTLMNLPYLKLVGGLALLVIAAKLLVPEDEDEGDVHAAAHLWAAVQIVAIADIVMSLDNVIAVAAAANGSIPLLVLGLAISVPLIVAGAALIMALLTRLPALVWAGAGLLGWIAGEVMASDGMHDAVNSAGKTVEVVDPNTIAAWLAVHVPHADYLAAVAGAVFVVALGLLLARRREHKAGAS